MKKRKKLELIHQSSACMLKKTSSLRILTALAVLIYLLQLKPVPTAYIIHWFLCLLKKKKNKNTQPLIQKAIYGNIICTMIFLLSALSL